MARTSSQSASRYADDASDGDWGSLRDELVTLLQRVDAEVGRGPARDRAPQDMGAPMGDARHRDALRSVQRAIDRFEDAAEAPPPSPRDNLQSAIAQIRARQGEQMRVLPPQAPAPAPVVPRADLHLIDKLTQNVSGLGARMERLETEIRAQVKAGASVKDVADQVAQLAHVVELLAGAVGETGQVKRLEGQIASLGKIMSQGREMDVQALTRRLDDVAATVGKLAELQVHYADLVQNPVQQAAFQDGMRAIEENVRNVYDRIDVLEQRRTLTPEDLQVITDQMAQFTAAMRDGQQAPLHLVELVDALNGRISEIESGDRLVHSLRKDLGALRDAVIVSLTPRFDAIDARMEQLSTHEDMAEIARQIGALNDRIVERPYESGIGQLEAQVRHLVARMDQTGEQLSGLAQLYKEPAEVMMPDFDAVAELVASRAAAAVQQQVPAAVPSTDPQLAETLSALEMRITDMLSTMRRDNEVDQFGGMQSTIDEVNERLKRLETSLATRAATDAAPVAAAIEPSWKTPAVPRPEDVPVMSSEMSGSRTGFVAEPMRLRSDANPMGARSDAVLSSTRSDAVLSGARSDAMPRDPHADAPLIAPAFPDPKPDLVSNDARNGHRKHPGLDDGLSLAARYTDKPATPTPSFAADSVPLPPAPTPSPEFTDVTPGSSATQSSRNTFIEAHRRAAQRGVAANAPEPASGSLIGKALARFASKPTKADATPMPVPEPVVAKAKPEKSKPAKVKAEKPSVAEKARRKMAPEAVPGVAAPLPTIEPVSGADFAHEAEIKESFLLKHRRAILLGAAVVAVACLTVNFVAQRLAPAEEPAAAASDATPAPAATDAPASTGSIDNMAAPVVDDTASMPPRVIPMTDSLSTGSINNTTAMGFTSGPLQPMPNAFSAAKDLATGSTGSDGVAPLAPDNGVRVEMPPDALGPVELRTAAASGDARAQFEIGAIYTEGRAVQQDYKSAAIWYERAAAQGFAPAEYRLGSLYESGNGVDKDPNTARLWYERAAEAGNRMSMHNLAALYAGGALGEQAFDAAAKWFEEAANLGLTDSQFNLGMLYARGLGVPQDLKQSFKWFAIAAMSGDKDAAKARDDMARSLDADTVAQLTAEVKSFVPGQIDLKSNFAPLGTWSKTFDPGETIDAKDIVASVQKALGRLGFDVGVPDGVAGKKTHDAIRAFEDATGMSESGQINPRLLAVLGSQPV